MPAPPLALTYLRHPDGPGGDRKGHDTAPSCSDSPARTQTQKRARQQNRGRVTSHMSSDTSDQTTRITASLWLGLALNTARPLNPTRARDTTLNTAGCAASHLGLRLHLLHDALRQEI
jgi:hypothetical protein